MGTKKTAGMIMSTLGAMGGGVHKALRKADRLVEKSKERGRVDMINVQSDGSQPGKKTVRLKPMATKDASCIGRVLQYKVIFQILFALALLIWMFRGRFM